jgi:hypothetical protein
VLERLWLVIEVTRSTGRVDYRRSRTFIGKARNYHGVVGSSVASNLKTQIVGRLVDECDGAQPAQGR